MLIPDITNPFFAEIIKGVQAAAIENEVSLILCETKDEDALEAQFITLMHDKSVDGLLVSSLHDMDNNIELLERLGIKYVLLNRTTDQIKVPYVKFDNYDGARLAMEYLIKNGHKKIAHISGLLSAATGIERYNAYINTMKKYGLPIPEDYIIKTKFTQTEGYAAMERLLKLDDRPTAVFACNDMTALGAYKAIYTNGLTLPNDMSIVGFNNIWLCDVVWPPLTTVNTPMYEMGEAAFKMLNTMIKGETPEYTKIIMDTELVERESVLNLKCNNK
jgi:DNA-binding LacI/PurR family transcriptional regulator